MEQERNDCEYVLEHMKNPFNLILEMKRVCKPGGRIVIITDNAGYVYTNVPWRTYHGDYSDRAVHKKEFNKDDRHYVLFTSEHLRNLFIAADLRIAKRGYMFWKSIKSKKSIIFHNMSTLLFGERFAMPSVYIVGTKE